MDKLRRHEEFEAVLKSPGRALVRSLFIVRFLPRPDGPARLGIVVGKKALRKAVDRNRAKRMVRETFRAMQDGLPGIDLVVQLRGGFERTTRAQARRQLTGILGQIVQADKRWAEVWTRSD